MRGRGGFVPSGGGAGGGSVQLPGVQPYNLTRAKLDHGGNFQQVEGRTLIIDVGDGPVTWTFRGAVAADYDVKIESDKDQTWLNMANAVMQSYGYGFNDNIVGGKYLAPIKQVEVAYWSPNFVIFAPMNGAAGNACTQGGTASLFGSAPFNFMGGQDATPGEEGDIVYFGAVLYVFGDGQWQSVALTT